MKRPHFLISFVLFAVYVHGQSSNAVTTFKNVIGPSPNAAAIEKYVNIPVSTYTGVVNIDIPIYSIVNKDLKFPVSLSYHASGIRVDEEASRVGLGWFLTSGAVINRSVNGNDDFNSGPLGHLNNTFPEFFGSDVAQFFKSSATGVATGGGCYKYIMGNLYNFYDYLPTVGIDEKFHPDLEPDVFSYNIPGYSGKFVIRKNRQIIKEKPDALKIDVVETPSVKFQITDPSGNKYIFDKTEHCVFSSAGGTSDYITSWYISKIQSPTGAEINFHYSSEGVAVRTLAGYNSKYSMFTYSMGNGGASCSMALGISSSYPPIKQYPLIYIDSISYPFGSVDFTYEDRIDIKYDKRLVKIRVNNHADPAKSFSYDLVQDYFTKTMNTGSIPDPELNMDQNVFDKRLKLVELVLRDAGNKIEKRHQFIYNEQNLPSKKSYARDHWGFFNGQVSNNTLLPNIQFPHPFIQGQTESYGNGANREPDPTYNQAFLLKQIKYPTGGESSFEYESNEYSQFKSTSGPSDPNGEYVQDTKYFYARRGQDDTYTITFPQRQLGSKIEFEITSQNGQAIEEPYPQSNDAYFEVYPHGSSTYIHRTLLGSLSFWQPDGSMPYYYKRSDEFDFPAGTYTIKTHIGSNVLFLNYLVLKFTYTYFKENTSEPPPGQNGQMFLTGGGIRIKKITDTDPVTGVSTIRSFKYGYQADKNNDGIPEFYSYGRLLSKLKYTNHELKLNCVSDAHAECDVFNLYSSSHIPLEGPIIGYDTTIVLYGETGQNGKEEFYYENTPALRSSYILNYGGGSHDMDIRPSGIRDLSNLKNGTLKKKSVFRLNNVTSSFEKLQEFEYKYSSDPEEAILGIRKTFTDQCASDPCQWRLVQYPVLESSWYKLDEEIVREYEPGTETISLETVKKYTYESNSPVHYQPIGIQSFNSKGEKQFQYITYPYDYTPGTGFIDNMKTAHVILPIEQVTGKEKAGTTFILSGSLTRYKEFNPTLPESIYITEIGAPLLLSGFKFSNRSAGVLPTTGTKTSFQPDPNYKPAITFDQYDPSNNLVQQTKIDDISKAYIWDYNRSYPICEVVNAAVSEIAYTSFEYDGSGSWNISSSQRNVHSYITGKVSYDLGSGSIFRSGLDPAKTFIISYWTKNSAAFTIDGTMPGYPLKGAVTTVNGETWTNYQHKVTGRNTITLTGNGVIDELRLHPVNAQMTTYTYDPLVGMTTMSDTKDNVVHYEYDALSRLLHIRDHDKNILKKFQYSYQAPVESAPQWTATGNTRCKPCPDNTSYTSNIGQIEEKDTNPLSSTYNQTRWTDNGVSSNCAVNPDWQFTSTPIRCKVVNGVNTGEQEREQMDMRPCSVTYGQTQWIVVGTNASACPLPCTTANCSGQGFKCINNICEEGVRVCTHSVPVSGGMYRTYFHYEFSDGSWSDDYSEVGPFMCGNNP
jgi:hypothetical protein